MGVSGDLWVQFIKCIIEFSQLLAVRYIQELNIKKVGGHILIYVVCKVHDYFVYKSNGMVCKKLNKQSTYTWNSFCFSSDEVIFLKDKEELESLKIVIKSIADLTLTFC